MWLIHGPYKTYDEAEKELMKMINSLKCIGCSWSHNGACQSYVKHGDDGYRAVMFGVCDGIEEVTKHV